MLLRAIFAKEDFREGQLDALFEVVEGRDCAVLLPTGAGKSLIYQLAGLFLPGRTLVVDPLVALMEDQVEGLRAPTGSTALRAISSFTTMQGMGEALLERDQSGEALFVFVSPERLQQQRFRQALRDGVPDVADQPRRRRRGALRLGVGPRLPHVVSQPRADAARGLPGRRRRAAADPRADGTASRAVLRDVLIELGIERDSERRSFGPQLRSP